MNQLHSYSAPPYPAYSVVNAAREAAVQASRALLDNLERIVNAEYAAIRNYERLIQLTPNADFKNIITNIRDDESGHFRIFSAIFTRLSGRQPRLTPRPLPTDFAAGVEEAITDELGDSKFYQNTSLLTDDPVIRRALLNASADETRHSIWFSYIWNKMR